MPKTTGTKVSVRVGNRRLLKLASFLRTLPRKRFDYTTWVGEDWQGAQDLSCGTTACALGWAATMPAFRRLGVRLKKRAWGGGQVALRGLHRGSIEVAMYIFALDHHEAHHLFTPEGKEGDGTTPKQVAKKIERFVKQRATTDSDKEASS